MGNNKVYDNLIASIQADRQDLVDLCLDLGNTPSPYGKEIKVGEKVLA